MNEQTKKIIEGLIFATDEPIGIEKIQKVFSAHEQNLDIKTLRSILEVIKNDYLERGIELVEVASGFRFQVRTEISPFIATLFIEKPQRYSRALMEVLAIIAYRQPITRAEIEEIRGVSLSSNIMRMLSEREWIQVAGHKDVPGKPALFTTTKNFLDYFNLRALSDLPPLGKEEIQPEENQS